MRGNGNLVKHSVFFYYGKEHFFINVLRYIKEGIANGEIIIMSIMPGMYEEFLGALDESDIDKNCIRFMNFNKLICAYQEDGILGMDKQVNSIIDKFLNKGHSGIRFIGQVDNSSKYYASLNLRSWEEDMTKVLTNNKASVLCCYDIECIIKNDHLDKNVIGIIIDTHNYVWSDFQLKKIDIVEKHDL